MCFLKHCTSRQVSQQHLTKLHFEVLLNLADEDYCPLETFYLLGQIGEFIEVLLNTTEPSPRVPLEHNRTVPRVLTIGDAKRSAV